MTAPTREVLRAFLHEPSREWYGLELCELTRLPSGTLYPIIARLERRGWLESRWEDPEAHIAEGRPRRRYYRLTGEGAERGRAALTRAHSSQGHALGLPGVPT
jgi:PadR family transcriptional regulator PadR